MKSVIIGLILAVMAVSVQAGEKIVLKKAMFSLQGDIIGKTSDKIWLETGIGTYQIPFALMREEDARRLSKLEDGFPPAEESVTYQGVLNMNLPSRDGSQRSYYWVNVGSKRVELTAENKAGESGWRTMVGQFVELSGVWEHGEYGLNKAGELVSQTPVFRVANIRQIMTEHQRQQSGAQTNE